MKTPNTKRVHIFWNKVENGKHKEKLNVHKKGLRTNEGKIKYP
jgi:hypothetical protein